MYDFCFNSLNFNHEIVKSCNMQFLFSAHLILCRGWWRGGGGGDGRVKDMSR